MNFKVMNLGYIKRADELIKLYRKGSVSIDSYSSEMAGMSAVGKMMDRHIKFLDKERQLKLSLESVTPDVTGYDPEEEKIKCPEQDDSKITRSECLDYSGGHNKECETCAEFKPTRNLLLPEVL